ncbi:hypothetical protein B0T24DRAFT_523136 [Lasiosphaeria ovina]|uniref:Nephrocystin 3-like N-terminal domain-containing protein n=1 Tax=Lasiosphaeria ovina TaxID=92902 RepID=A0AAE0KM25_9PEZI|nr:hypothetical protein B0T24DRAFT_523136 [Lasiosphaeria ovina]
MPVRPGGSKSDLYAKTTALLGGIWNADEIGRIKRRLESLRSTMGNALLSCLWENSRRTNRFEHEFDGQMQAVIDLLKKIDDQTLSAPTTGISGDSSSASAQATESTAEDLAINLSRVSQVETLVARDSHSSSERIMRVLKSLVRAGQSVSLSTIANEVVQTLNGNSVPATRVYEDILSVLWDEEWKPDDDSFSSAFADNSDDATTSLSAFNVLGGSKIVSAVVTMDLPFPAFRAREEAVAETFASTYSWVFNREARVVDGKPLWSSFPAWLEQRSGAPIYWVTGKPGSGKSTMMKFIQGHSAVVQHLGKWGDLPLVVAAYYAWNPGFSLQKSFEGLKRTILFQVLTRHPQLIPKLAPRRWALFQLMRRASKCPQWATMEIEESFSALLSEAGKSIRLALFIDGLDEFDVAPVKVLEMVDAIARKGGDGIKLCVASRPWTEFDDAYRDTAPALHMHLLTMEDITAYVGKKFDGCRAVTEIRHIYPDRARQLEEGVVRKASGIFIWVTLVVGALVESATEGSSIAELEAMLDALPEDIRVLYDAIWARILPRTRRDGAAMIQLVLAARKPLSIVEMWRASEIRAGTQPVAMANTPGDEWVGSAVRRRLASQTRGILDLTSETYVGSRIDFTHRTAHDWSVQPEVIQGMRALLGPEFDPALILLKVTAAKMMFRQGTNSWLGPSSLGELWKTMEDTMWYASNVRDDDATDTAALVKTLDAFDDSAQQWDVAFSNKHWLNWLGWDTWSGTYRQNPTLTFFGLAVQFSVLPYIRAKALANPRLLVYKSHKHEFSVPILECAIFGYRRLNPESWTYPESLRIPPERRLKTVRFLFSKGVRQQWVAGGMQVSKSLREVRRLRVAIQEETAKADNPELEAYFNDVLNCLDQFDIKSAMSHLSLKVRSAFVKSG